MSLIECLFRQTVVIRPFIRYASGEPMYGPPQTRKCRFQAGSKLTVTAKDFDGLMDNESAESKMFCVGTPIPTRSIVEYGDRDYIVIECEEKFAFTDSHLEVRLI